MRPREAGDVEPCLKAVYGVATSGRFWGKTLRIALEEIGVKRSSIDHPLCTIRSMSVRPQARCP